MARGRHVILLNNDTRVDPAWLAGLLAAAEGERVGGVVSRLLFRDDPGRGEAFTMLTTEPGPDVAAYHARQVAVLRPEQWKPWLSYAQPASELLAPLPAGTLEVSGATAA